MHHLQLLVLGGDLHTADLGGKDPARVLGTNREGGVVELVVRKVMADTFD